MGSTAKSASFDEFPTLWARVQPTVAAYINAAVPDFHAAEDILQQVAVVAFQKHEKFDPQAASYLSWVLGIARYEILHWQRSKARDRLVFSEATLEKLAGVECSISADLGEMRRALGFCLAKLEGRAQKLIEMRYMTGLNAGEIAERIGSSSGAVRVKLHRLRNVLLKCIRRKASEPEAPR